MAGTTDKGLPTIGNTDDMLGPAQVTALATATDALLGESVDTQASLPTTNTWTGRTIYVQDIAAPYVWNGSTWSAVTAGQSWTFSRSSSNTSDSYASATFTSLVTGTITSAPAGNYLILVTAVHSGSSSGTALLRLLAGAASTNLSSDQRFDVQVANQPLPKNWNGVYAHTGGDLKLTMQINNTTANGTVYTVGTKIVAVYLGPAVS